MNDHQPTTDPDRLTEAERFILLNLNIRTGVNLYTISDEHQYGTSDATHANALLEECHLHRERLQEAVRLKLLPAYIVPTTFMLVLPELDQFEEALWIVCPTGLTFTVAGSAQNTDVVTLAIISPLEITEFLPYQHESPHLYVNVPLGTVDALVERNGGVDMFRESV